MSQTKDYDKFNMLDFNRDLDRRHINKLKKSITQNGYLVANPIIVDSDYNIIDGQHRFIACMEMGLPIYYEIVEDSQNMIIDLNTTQKKWNMADYVNYYASKGNAHYQRIKTLKNKSNMSYDLILTVANKQGTSGTTTDLVRKGGLCFTLDDSLRAQSVISVILDICNNLKFNLTSRIAGSLVDIANIRNFKWDRLIRQTKEYPTVAYKCRTKDEYIKMFKDLYNYQSRKEEVRI